MPANFYSNTNHLIFIPNPQPINQPIMWRFGAAAGLQVPRDAPARLNPLHVARQDTTANALTSLTSWSRHADAAVPIGRTPHQHRDPIELREVTPPSPAATNRSNLLRSSWEMWDGVIVRLTRLDCVRLTGMIWWRGVRDG